MSIRRYSIMFCDWCGEHSFDDPPESATEARDNAKRDGWRVVLGKDICPNHDGIPTPQMRAALKNGDADGSR